jgi:hypothetical protein
LVGPKPLLLLLNQTCPVVGSAEASPSAALNFTPADVRWGVGSSYLDGASRGGVAWAFGGAFHANIFEAQPAVCFRWLRSSLCNGALCSSRQFGDGKKIVCLMPGKYTREKIKKVKEIFESCASKRP